MYFIMILMLFFTLVVLMIISPNISSIILGWDGLGLISYCLIIYYQNFYSYNSGMLTLLTNRIEDVLLLMKNFMMMNLWSWNLLFLIFNNKFSILMFLFMIMTESAQIPFSMWLPAAMAAPIPVLSLMHSSTLVTAGIYLLISFNEIFSLNYMNPMISYSMSNAMFKSLLFLCSGVMIHFVSGIQDIHFMVLLINEVPLVVMYFNFSYLSLCGFSFLFGLHLKDLWYEMSLNLNLNKFIHYFMYLCIMLTMMYTFWLMYYLIFNYNMYYSSNMTYDSFLMNLSLFMLFIMSIIFESMINSLLFSLWMMLIINFKIKLNLS